MAQQQQLVQELKLALKERGVTYRDAARALALSEARRSRRSSTIRSCSWWPGWC